MGNLTIVLDNEVERRLRMKAAQLYGVRRGALSTTIQKAIENWLGTAESQREDSGRVFLAYRGNKSVAEAESLRELVGRLKESGIDPRSVEIRSSETPKPTARLGMRLKAR